MGITQLLIFAAWILFGFCASNIAKKRNRNPRIWFFIGMFMGLLGILLVWILPPAKFKGKIPPPTPNRSDSWLTHWYYLDRSHKQQGPIEFPELIKLRKDDEINTESYIWGEGMEEWKKLDDMPELVQEITQK